MYLCFCMTLPDLFSLFFNSDPVSVCVVLYVIILIQIRIRYNVKNFITACTRLHDSDPQKWKISLPWEGDTPLHTLPPLGRFAPSGLVAPLPRIWYFVFDGNFLPFSCMYTGWPPKNGTVNFLGLCSDQQLSLFTLLDRSSFPHYNNTKIIKFGWELFILWVISYGLSFSGLPLICH